MNEAELKARTKQFALRCIRLAESLPGTRGGRAIGNQLVRCGTSVGANYRAVCRSRSKSEFVSRLAIVEEEADESAFWMELITESEMKPAKLVQPLMEEADQLVPIVTASIRTARTAKNPKSKIRNPK